MADDRKLLEELRRIDELERKAAGGSGMATPAVDGRAAAQDASGQPPVRAGMVAPTGAVALPPDKPEGSLSSDFAKGVGSAFTIPVQGVRQLAGGDVSPEDIKAERAKTDSIGGYAGNMAGNLIAGGPVFGLTRAAMLKIAETFLPKILAKSAAVASVPAAAGIEGSIVNPTLPGESRGENAAISAAVGTGAQVGGAFLRRALTGAVQPSADTVKLMGLGIVDPRTGKAGPGIYPTPGQGGDQNTIMGKIARTAENILSYLPLGPGAVVHRNRERPALEAADIIGHRSSPIDAIDVTPGRGAYVNEIKDQFDDAYKTVLGNKRFRLGGLFKTAATDSAAKKFAGVPDGQDWEMAFRKDMGSLLAPYGRTITGPEWKSLQVTVRERIREAEGSLTEKQQNRAWADAYRKVDDHLNRVAERHLTPTELAALKDADLKSLRSTIVNSALDDPSEVGGASTMRNIIKSYEKNTPPAIKIREGTFDPNTGKHLGGEFGDIIGPYKTTVAPTISPDVLARKAGYVQASNIAGGLGLAGGAASGGLPVLAGVAGLSALGSAGAHALTSQTGSRFFLGDMKWQKTLADKLRKINPALAIAVGGSTEERQ